MSNVLKKSLLAAALVVAAASLCSAPAAFAAEKKAVKAKAAAKPAKAGAKAARGEDSIPDGPDADITDTATTDYNCELGAKLTIFANEKDDSHIALRWKKRIHRLDKVGTTTGALRFENATFGLIWIGIPSKGMLLDAKLNRQLANECKNAEQERGIAAAPAQAEKQAEQPSAKVKVKVEPIVPPLAPAATPAPASPTTPI
jgi:membrane-bound inhibitor of C-type lysozyme